MRKLCALVVALAASCCSGARLGQPQRSNASEEEWPCYPPDDVHERAESRGMVLLSSSARHVVYTTAEEDDGDSDPEMSLLVFDCVRRKELMFVHIPKNAGTTITTISRGRFNPNWGTGADSVRGTRSMPDGSVCTLAHVPPHMFDPPNPYEDPGTDVFCVTRDPWERMRSEYGWSVKCSKIPACRRDMHRRNVALVRPLNGSLCSLEAFNGWAMERLGAVEGGRPYSNDCHLVPQWSFVEGPDGKRWCKETLPIAQLSPRFNELMESRGINLRLPPHRKANPSGGQCPELAGSPIEEAFWPSTRVIMRRVYRNDFLHLGDSMKGSAGLLINASAGASV
jgi:hypothetical protein